MKNTFITSILISLVVCFTSCKKETNERQPIVGKVLLTNSNTPVDHALVRFIRYLPSSWLGAEQFTVTQEVITDENGEFTIPDTTSAQYVQAWGLESIYRDTPSQEINIASYWGSGGGVPKLYLTPPAWLKILARDIDPASPEITSLQFSTTPNISDGGWQEITQDGMIWKTSGQSELNLRIRLCNSTTNSFELEYPTIESITAFDTTTYVIEY